MMLSRKYTSQYDSIPHSERERPCDDDDDARESKIGGGAAAQERRDFAVQLQLACGAIGQGRAGWR